MTTRSSLAITPCSFGTEVWEGSEEPGEQTGHVLDAANGSQRAAVPDDVGGEVLRRAFRVMPVEDDAREVAGHSDALFDRKRLAHGCTWEPYPRSRRIDSITQKVVLSVNTSAAASTPVYFSLLGAAATTATS